MDSQANRLFSPDPPPQRVDERPLRKIQEHLEDAFFHLRNSTLSEAAKVKIGHLIQEARRVLYVERL